MSHLPLYPTNYGRVALNYLMSAVLATSAASAGVGKPPLMPMPLSVKQLDGNPLTITGPVRVKWHNCGSGSYTIRAEERLEADLVRQTGLTPDRNRETAVEVTCRSNTKAVDEGEDYNLRIDAAGVAIEAGGRAGVLRAFATLRQLVGLSPYGIAIPAQMIEDKPRYAWRGVMLDPARHFLTLPALRRQIDAMERVKLNTLHLHLSDDQGFRVESRLFPKLNADQLYYSQKDMRTLVGYALDRGVRIVPEFDLPGHSRAIVTAYPELGVTGKVGLFGKPRVALNPASSKTYHFVKRLFGEMAPLFPDQHFHVGGDEVSEDAWSESEQIKALMAKEGLSDKKAVERYFLHRISLIVQALGKKMLGWDEVAAAGVSRDVMVQAWQTSNAMADSVRAGHQTIISAGYYLNFMMPAGAHYRLDPASVTGAGLSSDYVAQLRRSSPLLARLVLDSEIDTVRPPLTTQEERLLVGAEAALWGELVTDELLDKQLWPRAAAIAERFWSSKSMVDVSDMYRRLALVGEQLTVSGLEDQIAQDRLIRRLAPRDPEALTTLLSVTGPVRNMAHDYRVKFLIDGERRATQSFNDLADAAPVDSMVAHRFAMNVDRFVKGDSSLIPLLKAQLQCWKENDARYRIVAKGNRKLEDALPTSAQLAELAQLGLDALTAIESGRLLSTQRVGQANALLDTLASQEAASALPWAAYLQPQPAADLILKIGPGVRALKEAAAR